MAAMPTPMDTFRALAPPEGLRFTPLFSDPVEDANARMKRLEDAVQTIRNDLDTVVPTMVRMVAIEKDIKGLVAQLQTLTDQSQGIASPTTDVTPEELPPPANGGTKIPGEGQAKGTEPAKASTAKAGPAAPSSLVTPEAASKGELPPEGAASPSSKAPVDIKKPQAKNTVPVPAAPAADKAKKPAVPAPAVVAPAPAPAVTPAAKPEVKPEAKPEIKAEAAPAPAGSTIGDVSAIRIADHPDKTRVVLEMTAKAGEGAKIENNGKTLVIPLSQVNWLGKKSWDADSAQLISGYHIEGGNLYVDLMYASQIKSLEFLSPGAENKNYRLVIDLFSPEVHK